MNLLFARAVKKRLALRLGQFFPRLGDVDAVMLQHAQNPLHPPGVIIRRNTPLPATRTEEFFTVYPRQTTVDVQVYQGEDEDALKDILVGNFMINGLAPVDEGNPVLCRMSLNLDGILNVTAIDRSSPAARSARAGTFASPAWRPGGLQ